MAGRKPPATGATALALPAHAGFFARDAALGWLPGQLTPRVQEGRVRRRTPMPAFGNAARAWACWRQGDVHRTRAGRITAAAGAPAVARQARAAAPSLPTHPLPVHAPDQRGVRGDGALVPLLHGPWAEARTRAVGAPVVEPPAAAQAGVRTTARSSCARLTHSPTVGALATGAIHRRGVAWAGRVGAVVDGAAGCQPCSALHAPAAVRILDFARAAAYVAAIGQTAGAHGPLLAAAARARLGQDRTHYGPPTVLRRLRTAVVAADDPGATTTQLA